MDFVKTYDPCDYGDGTASIHIRFKEDPENKQLSTISKMKNWLREIELLWESEVNKKLLENMDTEESYDWIWTMHDKTHLQINAGSFEFSNIEDYNKKIEELISEGYVRW